MASAGRRTRAACCRSRRARRSDGRIQTRACGRAGRAPPRGRDQDTHHAGLPSWLVQIVVTPEALDLLESLDPSGHLPDSGAAVVRDRKIVENVDLEPGFPDPARQIDVIEEDRKAFVEQA